MNTLKTIFLLGIHLTIILIALILWISFSFHPNNILLCFALFCNICQLVLIFLQKYKII